jgi:hypothetical protein
MGIGKLQIRLHRDGPPLPRPTYSLEIDGGEYVTSSFLLQDIGHLMTGFGDMGVSGKRFDLFFTGADPFSISIINRDGTMVLRITDNFDGGVLEEALDLTLLKAALAAFIEDVLGRPGIDDDARCRLREGLDRFRAWPGPGLRK